MKRTAIYIEIFPLIPIHEVLQSCFFVSSTNGPIFLYFTLGLHSEEATREILLKFLFVVFVF